MAKISKLEWLSDSGDKFPFGERGICWNERDGTRQIYIMVSQDCKDKEDYDCFCGSFMGYREITSG